LLYYFLGVINGIGCNEVSDRRLPMVWLYLSIAVVAEDMAITALKFVEGYTLVVPTAIVVIGYGIAFFVYLRC